MELQDLRIIIANVLAFSISLTNLETWLRIILLVVSIVYTIYRLLGKGKKN